jgi:hypothetical protein
MTEDLIDRLAGDLRPAPDGAVVRRLALALGAGGLAAFAGVSWRLGLRPDLAAALASPMFWIKLAFALALGAPAAWAVERLARPGGRAGRRLVWLAAPAVAILVLAWMQLARSARLLWGELIMGHSARVCPWLIAATAAPLFVALIWALRGLAPTRLRLAGAAAGLAAGGLGAAIYSLHCPEAGAPFVAIWYSLGILIPCVLGGLLGPRLLRW